MHVPDGSESLFCASITYVQKEKLFSLAKKAEVQLRCNVHNNMKED
jgi:hypothetical protein